MFGRPETPPGQRDGKKDFIMKQIKFHDIENDTVNGGIMLDNGDVVCGCCGGLLPADEMDETWELIEAYDYWVDLTETIIGD